MIYYDREGETIQDIKNAVACEDPVRKQYFILRHATAHRYFHPINDFLSRGQKVFGRDMWTLSHVKPAQFQMYVKFLQTKNESFLQATEQERF